MNESRFRRRSLSIVHRSSFIVSDMRNSTDIEKPATISKPPVGEDQQLSLFSPGALAAVQKEASKWRREVLEPATSKKGPWKKDFTTVSGMEVNPLATPREAAPL